MTGAFSRDGVMQGYYHSALEKQTEKKEAYVGETRRIGVQGLDAPT
jgi:hypothetical protein